MSSIISLFLVALSCGLPAQSADVLVAGASDLASAEAALRAAFAKETGHRARFVFHSSGMLARQIEHGAPYDVYLSANELYVKQLVASGALRKESIVVYAQGRLGLWSSDGAIRELRQLRDSKLLRLAIANPAHAPYGVAARQALVSQGLWDELQPKIVLAENVRQTFQYGRSGNADAIITSWTLVFDKGGRMLPAEWHAPIRQAGGVLQNSRVPDVARQFVDFLTSASGRLVLSRHGLFPLR